MKSFAEQFTEYQQQHTEKANKIAHYIGIPAIVLGTLILLSWLSISIAGRWHISFAWIAVILLLIYYYFTNVKLAIATTLVMVVLTLICTWIGYPAPNKLNLALFLILFIGGWLIQLIGHTFEKGKPKLEFLTNITQVLMAPLFIVAELILILKLEKYFDLDKSSKSRMMK